MAKISTDTIFPPYDYSVRAVGSVCSLSPYSTYSYTASHNFGCCMWTLYAHERRGGWRTVCFKTTQRGKSLFSCPSVSGIKWEPAWWSLELGAWGLELPVNNGMMLERPTKRLVYWTENSANIGSPNSCILSKPRHKDTSLKGTVGTTMGTQRHLVVM